MKISERELIDLVLIQCLKELPEKLILNYTSGKVGLNFVDDIYAFNEIVALYSSQRSRVTNKISKQQLLKRIRHLIKWGFLASVTNPENGFFMYRPTAFKIEPAFDFAVEHLKRKGLSHKNPIKIDNLQALLDELRALLLEKFAGGAL